MRGWNKKRCILTGLLFAGTLLSFAACNGKENEDTVSPTTKIINLSTIDQYNQLLDGFRITSNDDTGTSLYDECFGGAYVNDRMELVVLLAENTPENQALVREYTGYEDIIIESCEYSRNELHRVKDRLNLAWEKLRAEGVDLGGMGPDEMENRVVVYVYNLEEGETEKLFEAAKSDCLIVHNVTIEATQAPTPTPSVEDWEMQKDGVAQYQQLEVCFATGETNAGKMVYDDCYGGGYLDENKALVVLLAEDTPENRERVIAYTGNPDIEIRTCEYSKNELNKVMNEINDHLRELQSNGSDFSSMSREEKKNRVVIRVRNLTEEKEAKIRAIVDSGCMVFENTDEINVYE